MLTCPTCDKTTQQYKAGTNPIETARWECQHCRHTYTAKPKLHGYPLELRRQALKLYVDCINFRRIARHEVSPGKSQTFSVEGDNSELRHYLTKALFGAVGAAHSLFHSVFVGTGEGGGVICVRLEPAAAVQAHLSEDARQCLRFCYRLTLGTPQTDRNLTLPALFVS